MACNTIIQDTYCQVQCQSGYDFVFNPPLYYFCVSGVWNMYALEDQEYSEDLPWPDCAGTFVEWFGNSTLARGCRPYLTTRIYSLHGRHGSLMVPAFVF